MKACTFFGHRECPENIRPMLVKVILDLALREGVEMFYVGNQGQFDQIVLSVLRELNSIEPRIQYAVVLAYMPNNIPPFVHYAEGETMYPKGLETVHPRFAISRRNDWMLNHADYVVTYVAHSWGGAAKYYEKAKRMKKTVWSIYK